MLTDLLKWGKRGDTPGRGDAPAPRDEPTVASKAFPKFVATIAQRDAPVLLDLGPVIGSNVAFCGERLGCKLFIEDFLADVDRQLRGKGGDLAASIPTRFSHGDASIDGILCWDLFDFLDKASGPALAKQLARILRPDGALVAFFNTTEPAPGTKPQYTRYVVADPANLQHRSYPAQQARQKPLNNRDIQRMFEPLRVTEQFLLKSTMREVLFRKPAG
jgi:hypothetical protein